MARGWRVPVSSCSFWYTDDANDALVSPLRSFIQQVNARASPPAQALCLRTRSRCLLFGIEHETAMIAGVGVRACVDQRGSMHQSARNVFAFCFDSEYDRVCSFRLESALLYIRFGHTRKTSAWRATLAPKSCGRGSVPPTPSGGNAKYSAHQFYIL